ncbi:MAG: HAD-IG family 5'-nucleotidase [Deltaproteobacteria bacterium]|nr:HAD-IG family 5'-nucleotidase [Deltaproteobacteria bacterium]
MTLPTFSPLPADLLKLIGADENGFDAARAVYTNRDLDLSGIKLVGFDMDYTLAIYNKAPMEQLQYDLTVDRLIENAGYPKEIKQLTYDPSFVIRGLVVDKRTGHILKMDTHGRVARAFHGLRRLSPDEVKTHYFHAKLKLGSEALASADTLFSMPEICLYANLMEFFEHRLDDGLSIDPLALPLDAVKERHAGRINTWKLFDDVREGIDSIHRDGSLKSVIMADLGRYFVVDDNLALSLHKLRSAGKRLFVLTNSFWLYTDAVMSFLLDGRLKEYATWRQFFDVVICGGKKPAFFTERRPFLEVAAVRGSEQTLGEVEAERFERNRVYQGGNIADFERMANAKGEEILYVGDHIFGDIVRSRKDSRWRTCLVVEELEGEIRGSIDNAATIGVLDEVDAQRHALDDEIAIQRALLERLEGALSDKEVCIVGETTEQEVEDASKRLKKEIDVAKRGLRALDKEAHEHQDTLDKSFNASWGRLFKASNELSRFGAQVELYACTYTSRVSNFRYYSPVHFFRAPRELMSHDAAMTTHSRKKAARSRIA